MTKLDRSRSGREKSRLRVEPPDLDQWPNVAALVEAALGRPADEQGAWLEEACGHDEALRAEALELLAAVGEADQADFLEAAEALQGEPSGEVPLDGRLIGPYRLVRLLGRGGFGAVYLAERTGEFERRVALKLIQRGLERDHNISRFHLERQILANLEHPGIARLLDGGTTDEGVPYFVMEYVEGEPIDRYCEHHAFTIRQRLELFLKVCSAIRFAHQNLIVHRDIKPANILVTADGNPKLLDFGIAKLLHSDSATQTLTREGQSPMTLFYASPEQVLAQPISTASDVYSLGVLLYLLLTQRLPLGMDETRNNFLIMRAICETKPQRPSEVIGRGNSSLRKALRGEVDAIVLRALAKEPEHRYSSVEQLAEDIHRHLEARPVLAHPSGLLYRWRKFVRRNKLAVALSVLVVAIGSGALGVYYDKSVEIRKQKDQLEEQSRRTDEAVGFLKDLVTAFDPEERQGEDLALKDILDRRRRELEADSQDSKRDADDIQAWLHDLLGQAYSDLGFLDDARDLHQEAVRKWREYSQEDHQQLVYLLNNLSQACYRVGDSECVRTYLQESREMSDRLGLDDELNLVIQKNNLANLLASQGDFAEAEKLYLWGLEVRRRRCDEPKERHYIASSLDKLGFLYFMWNKLDRAEDYLREALEICEAAPEPKHLRIASVLDRLAQVRLRRGDLREAGAMSEKSLRIRLELLGETHPLVAKTRGHLAAVRLKQGRLTDAKRLLDQALPVLRSNESKRTLIAEAESVLGALRISQGRLDEAASLLEASYQTLLEERSAHAITTEETRRRLDRLNEKRDG